MAVNANSNIQVRLASMADQAFILSLIPRLVDFGPPTWRNISQMIQTDTEVIREKLSDPSPNTVFFIAEDEQGTPLGFIHLQVGADYYQHERHGHIANLIVAREGEGQGIGRMLMERAEEWARAQGFRWLTLGVFAQNVRARDVYKKLGYGEDIMKYVKELT